MEEVSIYANNGRKPGGTLIMTTDLGVVEYHTARCMHCGCQWQVKPGSGKTRGWCMKCQGLVCGKKICVKYHYPMEAQLETVEALDQGNMKLAKKLLDKYGKGIIIGNI